jgi:LmbE family N-acetylglucosaminyl deacetylase
MSGTTKLRIAYSCAALLASVVIAESGVNAQTPCGPQGPARQDAWPIAENRGAAALDVALQQLHTRASMLMITAHPDDEDGATLAYESRALGARVGLLTLNRGEGGANEMSSDFWDALGLVRTEELLQADRYYCVTQYFTIAADYGFSKTLKEATDKWGEDRVFYDVVRVVRLTRPLVITSVFVGGPSDGHGNHAAAGMWAQKVFQAAGDPNVFPDQVKAGLRPWNPAKEYAHVPFSLEEGAVSPKGLYDYATHHWEPAGVQNYISGKFEPGAVRASVKIPIGAYSSVNGLSAQQISRTGLGFQKSQNGGASIPADGPATSEYHRFGSRIAAPDQEQSFFDGIDISLMGIAELAGREDHAFLSRGLTRISDLVEQATHNFSAREPSAIAPVLADGLAATAHLINEVKGSSLREDAKYDVLHELGVKQTQFNNALALALGLSISANITQEHPPSGPFARFMGDQPTFQMAIPGQQFPVLVRVADSGPIPVTLDKVAVELAGDSGSAVRAEGEVTGPLQADSVFSARFAVHLPDDAPYTRPYFERPGLEQPYYTLRDLEDRNRSLTPYPLEAHVTASYHGVQIQLAEGVQTVERDPGRGVIFHPMPIGPAISVSMQQNAGVTPLGTTALPVTVRVHSNVKGPAHGNVRLEMPAGWHCEPTTADFSLGADGQEQFVSFQVSPSHLAEEPYKLTAVASYDGRDYRLGYTQIGYSGLRPYFLYNDAVYQTTGTDVKVSPNLQVAYIEGSGDDVPASLDNLGIHVHFLGREDLANGDLQKYDVVLVGVRGYAVRSDLQTYNQRILDYVKNGGVVLVQYQTPEYDHNFGPYPYTMTSDPEEVTDEASPVTFPEPSSAVLNWPNKITAKDFEGWIEERGSKFMSTWDPHYHAPIETHDPGQDPQKGGLLVARYGAGVYVYTAYAFYRELPLGVPGAYRLFDNLLSLSKNPLLKYQGAN